jgi:hypothetical protein
MTNKFFNAAPARDPWPPSSGRQRGSRPVYPSETLKAVQARSRSSDPAAPAPFILPKLCRSHGFWHFHNLQQPILLLTTRRLTIRWPATRHPPEVSVHLTVRSPILTAAAAVSAVARHETSEDADNPASTCAKIGPLPQTSRTR